MNVTAEFMTAQVSVASSFVTLTFQRIWKEKAWTTDSIFPWSTFTRITSTLLPDSSLITTVCDQTLSVVSLCTGEHADSQSFRSKISGGWHCWQDQVLHQGCTAGPSHLKEFSRYPLAGQRVSQQCTVLLLTLLALLAPARNPQPIPSLHPISPCTLYHTQPAIVLLCSGVACSVCEEVNVLHTPGSYSMISRLHIEL